MCCVPRGMLYGVRVRTLQSRSRCRARHAFGAPACTLHVACCTHVVRCMLHAPPDRAALRRGRSSDRASDSKDWCCTLRADAARHTAQVACWSLHDACCMLSAAAQRDLLIPYAGRDFAVDFPAYGRINQRIPHPYRQDGSRRAGGRDAIRGAKHRS